jgi:hypothetical protein
MTNQTITKRGIESALYVCPETALATSLVTRERVTAGVVTPFQGTALPIAGFPMADGAVRSTDQQQLVPSHPGDTARRPPA